MSFEYKCVGAPERPKKQRGVRGRSDRVALAMQEIIQAEAVDGWEYQRTDLVPVEEKSGLFSRAHEVHRAVLVFRRALDPEPRFVAPGRLRAAERGAAAQGPAAAAEPKAEPKAGDGRAGAGVTAGRDGADGSRDGRRMSLSAQRDDPQTPPQGDRGDPAPPRDDRPGRPGRPEQDGPTPPTRANRPPSGLG